MQIQFQFDSLSSFFAMNGYGFYVWLSYGLTLLAMGGLIWLTKREKANILAKVKKEQAREQFNVKTEE